MPVDRKLFKEHMEPDITTALLIGLAAGFLVAAGGAVKDAPYEGFKPATFWRSPIVAAIEAPILAELFDYPNPILLAMATIAAERATVEGWKIYRSKMPSKFLVGEWGIPKDLIAPIPQEKLLQEGAQPRTPVLVI